MARFRKLTKFLSDHFEAIDPEIVPLQVWEDINNNANYCVNHLNADLGSIQNANNDLDQIIGSIRPYMLSSKASAQAASHAFRVYNETINEAITATSNASNVALAAIEDTKSDADKKKDAIEAFATKLLGNEEQDDDEDESEGDTSIKSKFLSLYKKFKTHVEKTEEFYERLTEGDTNENAIKDEIIDAKNNALKSKLEIDNAWEAIKKHKKQIDDFHKQVYGEQDQDGNFNGGLKTET